MAAYTLTVRRRGATARERFASLPEALAALEARLDELAPGERRGREHVLSRGLAPVEQVALRGEVAGPGVRGGVDVRGDGSARRSPAAGGGCSSSARPAKRLTT